MHELAQEFRVQSESEDPEPKRNVVVRHAGDGGTLARLDACWAGAAGETDLHPVHLQLYRSKTDMGEPRIPKPLLSEVLRSRHAPAVV